MQVKIISRDQAIAMGLAKATEEDIKRGAGGNPVMFGAIGNGEEVLEVHEINLNTGEKKMIYEHPKWKGQKKRLKINEYRDKTKELVHGQVKVDNSQK